MSEYDDKHGPYPMLIQVLPGSEAEYRHHRAAARHSDESIKREALAPGVTASPQDDLIFRGGKVLPQMGFQNIYMGRSRLVQNLAVGQYVVQVRHFSPASTGPYVISVRSSTSP